MELQPIQSKIYEIRGQRVMLDSTWRNFIKWKHEHSNRQYGAISKDSPGILCLKSPSPNITTSKTV